MSTPLSGRASSLRGKGNASTSSAGGAGGGGSMGTAGGPSGNYGRGYPIGNPGGRAANQFSNRIVGIDARLAKLEMSARAGQISFTSMLDGDLKAYDLLGELKLSLGKQSDGKFGVKYSTGTAPPKPTVPLVSARQLGFVVGWDGLFADGFDKPSDLARIDVHVSTEGADFVPTGSTAYGSIFGEGAQPVFGNIQTYWVKLVAVSVADVPSPPSAAVDVRPLPATALAAESIVGIHFAGEIFLGTTFVAGRPDKAHIEINPSGIALYRDDQTPTVVFSTDEGNALITGSIQTALAGSGKARIVFNPFPGQDYNAIRFYSPDNTTWSSLYAAYGPDGSTGAVQLSGPLHAASASSTVVLMASQLCGFGMVNANTGFFTHALTIENRYQQLVGNGIRFITNYAAGDYNDTFFAWTDNYNTQVHTFSVLELVERYTSLDSVNKKHFPSLANAGNNLSLVMLNAGLQVMTYDTSAYANLFAANTSSSIANKTDLVDLTEAMAGDESTPVDTPLDAVMQVGPKRFQRVDRSKTTATVPVPEVSLEELGVMSADEKNTINMTTTIDVPTTVGSPEFGLIAEEIEAVAPEAVLYAPDGALHVNTMGVISVLWGATQQLAARVDELSAQVG